MTRIIIREQSTANETFAATVSFDGQGEYPITVRQPFSDEEEVRLAWYFEEHLRFPFTDQVKAREAAASISSYGEQLFEQVFADRNAYTRYREALQAGMDTLRFEVAGSPEFQCLHWEALKDPQLPRPFTVEAPMVRKTLKPQSLRASLREAPAINVLVVVARPGGQRDVGYRTISRPLVDLLRQVNVPVRVEILRPGTYQAMAQHLEDVRDRYGAGYYHVIHFDVHGAVLSYDELRPDQADEQVSPYLHQARYGRADLARYEGRRAFLFLETETEGQIDPVEAGELANLLQTHQVPIVVLNACQSSKQAGANEASLASRLMEAGAQLVLAMGYSITVSAAEMLMQMLYAQLFAQADLATAIRRGRLEIYNRKGRRAYYNQTIDLEDWLLPIVYENQELRLRPRAMADEETKAYYERIAARYEAPEPEYGFVGRALDILHSERRLLKRGTGGQHNVLLVRGMGGAGKTTLLRYLAWWWQTTGFVDQVLYFGYDERAWTRQQIMYEIAGRLLTQVEYVRDFQPLGPEAQQALLAGCLRAKRHLLILDNLESITGAQLAIQHTLPGEEQRALQSFLKALVGGQTLVLLGSRSSEEWLAPGTFKGNVYDLPGLDPEAASVLAERILERCGAVKYRADEQFQHLLALLNGYPLAMEAVLANLTRQTPGEVLAALQAGDVRLDAPDGEEKTMSILRCIDYSHSNLAPEAQDLLLCLAPFTSVLDASRLPVYSNLLRQQPALAALPFERWDAVVQEAINWGLLRPSMIPNCLQIQPVLPYFLRARLQAPEQEAKRHAIEQAFRQLYDSLAEVARKAANSKDANKWQSALAWTRVHYENLVAALELSLMASVSPVNTYFLLSTCLEATQEHRRALGLGQRILQWSQERGINNLPLALVDGILHVISDVGRLQLSLKDYKAGEASFQQVLALVEPVKGLDPQSRAQLINGAYHNLGRAAEEQRHWVQAEGYYKQALALEVESNDRYGQAITYHNLGAVAQKHQQWAQAEEYYHKALALKREINDRHSQALTYHQLGTLAQAQRQWAQAEQYYQQALALKIEFNDRHDQASTYHQLGKMAQAQQEWAQAAQHYRQALAIEIEFNNRHSQALTYHQLGMMAQQQRQWAQAEQYYQQALTRFIEFGDHYNQAQTYHWLGMVAHEQKRWAPAEEYYSQALTLEAGFEDHHYQASTYQILGSLAQDQGKWAQAQEHLLKALSIAFEFHDDDELGLRLRSLTMHSLARLWRDSGDASLPAAIAAISGDTPDEVEETLRQAEPDDASA